MHTEQGIVSALVFGFISDDITGYYGQLLRTSWGIQNVMTVARLQHGTLARSHGVDYFTTSRTDMRLKRPVLNSHPRYGVH